LPILPASLALPSFPSSFAASLACLAWTGPLRGPSRHYLNPAFRDGESADPGIINAAVRGGEGGGNAFSFNSTVHEVQFIFIPPVSL
jgi:hypothetical protein